MVDDGCLDAFAGWLRRRRLAPENRIPYFVRWTARFLRLRRSRPREDWHDTLRRFLEDLGAGRAPDWQIRQAAEAVTLFCGQFRTRAPGHEAAAPAKAVTLFCGQLRTPAPGGGAAAQAAEGKACLESPSRALDEMRRLLRLRHYSPRTLEAYLGWAARFLRYAQHRGEPALPRAPAPDDAKAYLSYLATRRKVSASTQNQAFNALLFLFRGVFETELGDLADTVRARRGRKLPLVLSVDETRNVLAHSSGTARLMLELLYGSGLRLNELAGLRVKDLDLDAGSITVRAGKGDRDRTTLLPERLKPSLRTHLAKVKALHDRDLAAGAGEAPLPHALARKYPSAGREWPWQFVFPSQKLDLNRCGVIRRWHVSPATVQKAMKKAVRRAGLTKPASVHTLRHCFATHLLMKGTDIRRIQDLLGHRSVETTMIYTHVLRSVAPDVRSPLDDL